MKLLAYTAFAYLALKVVILPQAIRLSNATSLTQAMRPSAYTAFAYMALKDIIPTLSNEAFSRRLHGAKDIIPTK